jgi:hypothetical protein
MKCTRKDYCRSPVACGGFGYCRERNFDGYPMSQAECNRRKTEQDDSERAAIIHEERQQ